MNYKFPDYRFEIGPVKIFDGTNVYELKRGFNIARPEVYKKPSYVSITNKARRKPNISEETFMISTFLQEGNKSYGAYYVNEADIVRYEKYKNSPRVGLVIYNKYKYMWEVIDAVTERAYPLYEVVIGSVYASYFEHPEFLGYSVDEIELLLAKKHYNVLLEMVEERKEPANEEMAASPETEASEEPSPTTKENLPRPVPIVKAPAANEEENRKGLAASNVPMKGIEEDAIGKPGDENQEGNRRKRLQEEITGTVKVYVDFKKNDDKPATWAFRLENEAGQVMTKTNNFNFKGNDRYYMISSVVNALSHLTKKKNILLYTRDKGLNKLLNSNGLVTWAENKWRKEDGKAPNNVKELKLLYDLITRLGCPIKAEYASASELNLFAK